MRYRNRSSATRFMEIFQDQRLGWGFDAPTEDYVSRLTPYFTDESPYLLYVGRKELGKNAHLLIDYFLALKASNTQLADLKLVFAGPGSQEDLHRPQAFTRSDIIDVGRVSEIDKARLLKNALTLVQPSVNESFFHRNDGIVDAWSSCSCPRSLQCHPASCVRE